MVKNTAVKVYTKKKSGQVFTLILCVINLWAAGAMMQPRMLVVNVDSGVDDAWALLAFLRAQRLGLLRIIAVIAASGNTDMEHVCINTCRLLQSADSNELPVYRGVLNAQIERNLSETDFFGRDGFGDVKFDWEPDMRQVQPDDGPEFLDKLTTQHPGEISLVCLAPLSTIAETMKKYPNMTSNLRDILIMGGNYTEKDTEGSAEFNFLKDPESANTVLTQAKCPITLLPVEPCQKIDLSIEWRLDVFKHTNNPSIQMFNTIEQKIWQKYPDEKVWWQCDLFLACVIVNGKVAEKSLSTYARVELKGSRRGEIIIDSSKKHNVEIITKINSQELKHEVLKSAETV